MFLIMGNAGLISATVSVDKIPVAKQKAQRQQRRYGLPEAPRANDGEV